MYWPEAKRPLALPGPFSSYISKSQRCATLPFSCFHSDFGFKHHIFITMLQCLMFAKKLIFNRNYKKAKAQMF